MKISKQELAKILKEETEKFERNPSRDYIVLLEKNVVSNSHYLKENIDRKLDKLSGNKVEKVRVLEEILEQIEKINAILKG